jgi:hypothetical protein
MSIPQRRYEKDLRNLSKDEAPRAYARGIVNFFGGIRRSNSPSFALRATEGPSNAFIPGLTPVVFCVGG